MPDCDQLFRAFLELWQSMPRRGGKMPARADFTPTLAPAIMPHLFLGRVNGKFDLEVRLVGSALEEGTRLRLTGRNYFAELDPDTWAFYEKFILGYRAQPCAGRITRHIIGVDGLTYTLHSLAAPLADEDGAARYIAGVSHLALNHDMSAERLEGGEGRAGFGRARVADAHYIDLGFGAPPGPPLPKVAVP